MQIICRNTEDDSIVTFNSIQEVLEEINRDRSEEWTDYDESDWEEGLATFTEFVLVEIKQ